jgi:hypothetical protein
MRVDTSVMPAATETGAHTFGCLVDGWAYVGGRYYDQGSPYIYDTNHSIVFTYSSNNTVDVCVKVEGTPDYEENKYLKFTINNVDITKPAPQNCNFTNARFSVTRATDGNDIALDNEGIVKITNITSNDSVKFMSGTFYGTRISEGRFDVHYRNPLQQKTEF